MEMKSMEMKSPIRTALENMLPPILYRNHPKFRELVGLSPRSLCNEDSRRRGPSKRVYLGRICGYPREELIRWLEGRSRVVEISAGGGAMASLATGYVQPPHDQTAIGMEIVRHSGGFVEVPTVEGMLLLTEDEFKKATRRGASVALSRQADGRTNKRPDDPKGKGQS